MPPSRKRGSLFPIRLKMCYYCNSNTDILLASYRYIAVTPELVPIMQQFLLTSVSIDDIMEWILAVSY